MVNPIKRIYFCSIAIIIIITITNCQPIISHNLIGNNISNNAACQGYTLISPRKDRSPFLIDMDGNCQPKFYSAVISSVQRLPNGNTLINEGTSGRIFEVTSEKEIVWQYCYEGEGELIRDDWVYRSYRVPPEWVPGNPSNYINWEFLYGE